MKGRVVCIETGTAMWIGQIPSILAGLAVMGAGEKIRDRKYPDVKDNSEKRRFHDAGSMVFALVAYSVTLTLILEWIRPSICR